MALSATKQAKIIARKTRAHREGNIRALTGSLFTLFLDANWDAQARIYLRTGVIERDSFLDLQFRTNGLTA